VKSSKTDLNVARQRLELERDFPDGQYQMRQGRIVGTIRLQPTTFCAVYKVRITYSPGARPEIEVLSPRLVPRGGERIPHTFDGDRPCLHLQEEWRGDQSIATTIVPWLSEWLYYYETHHATGKWLGGGHQFRPKSRSSPSNR
jgi:hypothetical protein